MVDRARGGIVAVIGEPGYPSSERVSSLTPELVKGLEFDLVVLVRPDEWGDGIRGLSTATSP
ncbi:hypothetical protein [Tessaracoccus coleopterorum]|uniref:hypothetical protein n=1 Tax=Tessaracoccus coleopterorum TaxID=2714950 RepID=UPI001E633D87|nr:hypothetical protein [Tessaracoccus coleopterorum]